MYSALRYLLVAIILFLNVQLGFCQSVLQAPVSGIRDGESLTEVLARIEQDQEVRFFYAPDWLTSFAVTENLNGIPLGEFLDKMLKGSDFSFKLLFGYAIVIMKDPKPFREYKENLIIARQQKKMVETISFGEKKNLISGKQYRVTGTVRDQKSGSPQHNVTVLLNNKVVGLTNQSGQFEITSMGGDYLLSFRSVTFEEKMFDMHLYSDGQITVSLEEQSIVLDEITIRSQNLVNNEVGQLTVNLTDLKRSAALLGEIDVIRQLQSQAGITNTGEISGGFNVRGGGVDQNLILFDGIPVFSTYHAIGLFSSFNNEAIRETSFYKGGIPAQYGGRISSVLNIQSRSGDKSKWDAGGGIGMLSSHVHFGGPIKKETTTLFASLRGSYSDWVLNSIKSKYKDLKNSSLAFVDGTMKIEHMLSERSRVSMSAYMSSDEFSLSNDSSYHYQNRVGSIQFYHQFSGKFSGNLILGAGEYKYTLKEKDPSSAFDLAYSVRYPSAKLDFNYDGAHQIAFGLQNTYYQFNPGSLTPTAQTSTTASIKMPREDAIESALYVSEEFMVHQNVKITAGLRFSAYSRRAPGIEYHYEAGKPRSAASVVDSTTYSRGSNMKFYSGLEPRIAIRYQLDKDASIKVGYNRMFQYIHLISNTASITPVDIWQSSNVYFKPQIADQFSLGYYSNLKDRTYEGSVEVFYKRIENILDFKNGAKLILNKYLEADLLPGKAKAYGVELSIQKIKGRLQGAANYTFARSLRKVNGALEGERINNGKTYPSNYDQPHIVNIEWRYSISRRHFFSGNFTYHTGRPMSVPFSSYRVDDVPVLVYSERNNYRIPDYHRLDFAFIIEGNHKKKKILDGTWTFSVYNCYFRKNAYSVFYVDDRDDNLRPYKLTVIGTAVPSITYSFKI
jgi:hypothetical protein